MPRKIRKKTRYDYACDAFFKAMTKLYLALTFADVLLKTRYAAFKPGQADLRTRLSRRIYLKIPIVSSCMDTVTEWKMAIAMALQGGIGIIHKNLSIEAQAKMVAKVKHYINSFISAPICVYEDDNIEDVLKTRKIKGYRFFSFPVKNRKDKIVGLVTSTHFKYRGAKKKISEIMSTDIMWGSTNMTPRQAYNKMLKHRMNILPIKDRQGNFKGIFTMSDLDRIFREEKKYALDAKGRLLVGAAVSDTKDLPERMKALSQAGVDVVVIDSAHGASFGVLRAIRWIKKHYPQIDIIAGNVSNGKCALMLARAGADAIRVGQGGGSICTTRKIAGIGCPQITAIYDCAFALRKRYPNVPIIGDGGIESTGDMVLALAAGASTVMLGKMMAGTEEAPGKKVKRLGKWMKLYRGMGSLEAMEANEASRARYGQEDKDISKLVPEGVTSYIDYTGTVEEVMVQYIGGIHAGLGYMGSIDIHRLHKVAEFYHITNAGQKESHPHGLQVMESTVNYSA